MATIYRFETPHRGTEPRRVRHADCEPRHAKPSVRDTPLPVVEFGSGWYHDEAIAHSNESASHRCM